MDHTLPNLLSDSVTAAMNLSTRPATVVWLLLTTVTVASWLVGSHHGPPFISSRQAITFFVLFVAFLKVWLIFLYFMDVRSAPIALRAVCAVWTLAGAVSLVAVYLTASNS